MLVTLQVVNFEESAWNRAKNLILERNSAKRYGLWEYNSICLQGRKEHRRLEGRVYLKRQGYKNLLLEVTKKIQVIKSRFPVI
jgi:hypothetical protein